MAAHLLSAQGESNAFEAALIATAACAPARSGKPRRTSNQLCASASPGRARRRHLSANQRRQIPTAAWRALASDALALRASTYPCIHGPTRHSTAKRRRDVNPLHPLRRPRVPRHLSDAVHCPTTSGKEPPAATLPAAQSLCARLDPSKDTRCADTAISRPGSFSAQIPTAHRNALSWSS